MGEILGSPDIPDDVLRRSLTKPIYVELIEQHQHRPRRPESRLPGSLAPSAA